MLTKCEKDIANITAELAAIQDYDATIRKRKAEMKSSIDILGEIVKEGAISDSNLRLLIDDIVISECGASYPSTSISKPRSEATWIFTTKTGS